MATPALAAPTHQGDSANHHAGSTGIDSTDKVDAQSLLTTESRCAIIEWTRALNASRRHLGHARAIQTAKGYIFLPKQP